MIRRVTRTRLVRLAIPLGVVVGIVALSALLLAVGGYDVSLAMRALWTGSVGSGYALTSATLVRATPLILTGLAIALAFRAGVFNIGAEGQLLAGAAVGAAIGLEGTAMLGPSTLVVELAAGAIAGAAWAGIAAWLRSRFRVLEVISTIMLNFVALHAVGYLVRGPLQEPLRIYPQSDTLPDLARLPRLVDGTRLHWGLIAAVVAAALLWWVLRSTATGFRLRASGANPRAAWSAGLIDVRRVTAGAFLVSGGLAGLAGAVEVTGVTFALYENVSPGYGYTAIAVALLARLDPLAVVATGFFFGALEAGATAMQRDAGVPAAFVSVVEAGIVLAVIGAAAAGQMRGARSEVRAEELSNTISRPPHRGPRIGPA
jgi:simple sugar transport system permease protein